MGCNCGKNRRAKVKYILTRADGTTEEFPSQPEAQRANAKDGNSGTIKKDRTKL